MRVPAKVFSMNGRALHQGQGELLAGAAAAISVYCSLNICPWRSVWLEGAGL